ncbi:hypothetical protein F5X96DRAFT_690100 [Biscogniauxia mediterranea]|nr:hypothetical protein F5X96DRAFT_690100 [Biscogniauxia mediterranea]
MKSHFQSFSIECCSWVRSNNHHLLLPSEARRQTPITAIIIVGVPFSSTLFLSLSPDIKPILRDNQEKMSTCAVETAPLSGKSSSRPQIPERTLEELTSSSASSANDDDVAVASTLESITVSEQQQRPATQPSAASGSRPSTRSSPSGSSRRISSPEKLYSLFCGTNKDAQATHDLSSGSSSPKSSPVSATSTATAAQPIIATRAGPEIYKVRDRLANLARGPDDTTLRYTWFRDGLEQSRPPTRHDAALGRYQQRSRRQMRMPSRMDRCVDVWGLRDTLPYRSVEYKGELDDIEEAIGAMETATF